MLAHNAIPFSWLSRLLALAVCCAAAACVPVSRSSLPKSSSSNSLDSAHPTQGAPLDADLTKIRWMRIYGSDNETSPPILKLDVKGVTAPAIGGPALTLAFDMQSRTLPNLALILVHCDRNWKPTENIFVQDLMHLRSSDFNVQRAPAGVRGYDYSVSITFPDPGSSLKIQYSGNYRAKVVDYYDNNRVYGETRFFAVDAKATSEVQVYTDFYQSAQTEVVQRGLRVEVISEPSNELISSQIRAVALYRSGAWQRPMNSNEESRGQIHAPGSYWSSWDSFLGTKVDAWFYNLPAGNEHRILDLTDIARYPTVNGVISTPLSDLPRNIFNLYDHNGVALSGFVPVQDQDYIPFEFRLDLRGYSVTEDIAVSGTFNDWNPGPEWRLHYDKQTGFYQVRGLIKRAVHEYEYVSGAWDEDKGSMRNPDPTLIEGNVSGSTQLFYALVYYHETGAGGYDRIVGSGAGASAALQ